MHNALSFRLVYRRLPATGSFPAARSILPGMESLPSCQSIARETEGSRAWGTQTLFRFYCGFLLGILREYIRCMHPPCSATSRRLNILSDASASARAGPAAVSDNSFKKDFIAIGMAKFSVQNSVAIAAVWAGAFWVATRAQGERSSFITQTLFTLSNDDRIIAAVGSPNSLRMRPGSLNGSLGILSGHASTLWILEGDRAEAAIEADAVRNGICWKTTMLKALTPSGTLIQIV